MDQICPKKEFPIENGKIILVRASMVVTYYIELFRTDADRRNGILMSLLLLVAETISLHYQTVIDQRLRAFHQLSSWTSFGPLKCPIDKIICFQGHLTVCAILWVPCVLAKNSFTEIFSKLINVEIRRCKKFHCPLRKINLHYETVIDQKLTVVHQFFSWTSIGLSKCPIDKMIVW